MFVVSIRGARQLVAGEAPLPDESIFDTAAAADARVTALRLSESSLASIRGQADQALDGLRAYRDNASPTNAQTVTAVKLLCRVAIGLIRLQLSKLDSDS